MEDKKKFFYYTTLVFATVGGLYYVWKKLSKIKLNPWVEDYLNEIELMLKNKKDEIPLEAIGHIFQIITEVEEVLYLEQNSDLEEERVLSIKNEMRYRLLFAETMETRNEFYEKATKYVEKRLNISLAKIDEILKRHSPAETKNIIKNAKKAYPNVPNVPTSVLREAYIYYAKQKKLNDQFAQEQMLLLQINPDSQARVMANIYFTKNKLKDEIKAKYGFEEKYFDQLIEKHELLKDSEVAYYHDELKNIE